MAQILVLIRHGKAQPFSEEIDDSTRTLTLAGKRALRASLPDSLLPLAFTSEYVMGEVEVWSSSAVRAMETAEAAAAILDVDEITAHQSLFDQDVNAFLEELSESPADLVVAVGHEPFTGDLAETLCGVRLPFKTASVAIFDLMQYQGEPNDSVLRNFTQGPLTARWKTMTKVEDILCNGAAKVEENYALFLENPVDIEVLHDFRVSVRTLRSVLGFVKPYLESDQVDNLQKKLRDLVVCTSRLRELDVFGEMIAACDAPNEELVNFVNNMRTKECKAVLKEIGTKKAVKRACKMLDKVERITWKQHIEENGLGADDVLARFELMKLKFDSAYTKANYEDIEATHKLRKKAKRVRYASRSFESILLSSAEGVPDAMRSIQDDLGALCDARVNCELIDSMPRHKLSEEADLALAAIKQKQIDIILEILNAEIVAEYGEVATGEDYAEFDPEVDLTPIADDQIKHDDLEEMEAFLTSVKKEPSAEGALSVVVSEAAADDLVGEAAAEKPIEELKCLRSPAGIPIEPLLIEKDTKPLAEDLELEEMEAFQTSIETEGQPAEISASTTSAVLPEINAEPFDDDDFIAEVVEVPAIQPIVDTDPAVSVIEEPVEDVSSKGFFGKRRRKENNL